MKKIRSGKGQVFTWDIILATVLFMSFLTILIYLWTDTVSKINNAEIQYETSWLSTSVSEGLVRTPGTPVNWTLDPQLAKINAMGLADVEAYGNETEPLDRVLDSDKFLYFLNLTENDYRAMRNGLFGTGKYDYFMEFYCPDDHSLDCFNNLQADVINGTANVSCNGETIFYVKNHTVRSDKDLIATLRFDEGIGNDTYDSSGNDNNALNHGANWTNGKFGKALEFHISDKDYVEIKGYSYPDLNDSLTIEAWIKVNKSVPEWQAIVAKGEVTDPRNYFLGVKRNDQPNPNRVVFNYGNPPQSASIEGTTQVTDGNWHHVAATLKSNGTMRLFVDGRLENDVVTLVKPPVNQYPLVIGAQYDETMDHRYEYFFGGIIDDVMIFNRSLEDEEIRGEYLGARRACVIGLNTTANNTNYMIYDVKTVTFKEKANQERNFNEDINNLDPTARVKLIIYKKKGRDL